MAHLAILYQDGLKTKNQIINIGHKENEISIKELANKMIQIWISDFGLHHPKIKEIDGEEFYGPGYDDSDRRIPVIKKISALGWVPKYSIEAILRNSMNYYV